HEIRSDYAHIVSVDISKDSADFFIVNNIEKGDIVITQDYGLAAMSLSKEAYPINQNGLLYTDQNIDTMLNQRHIHAKLRREGKHHSKFSKRKPDLDSTFSENLRSLIESQK